MANLTNNGNGTFTLTPTAREAAAIQRAAQSANMAPLAFMEAKITSWIRSLRDKHDEQDAADRYRRYEALPADLKSQIDSILED